MEKNIDKKKVVQYIQECINLYNSSALHGFPGLQFLMFTRNDKSYMLGGASAEAYLSGLNLLLDYETLTDKYSSKGITEGFQSLMAKIMEEYAEVPDSKVIQHELNSWLASMLEAPEYDITHYMVVESIRMAQSYSIGKVVLEPLSKDKFEELFSKFCDRIDQNKVYPESKKEKIKQSSRQTDFVSFEPGKYNLSALMSITLSTRDLNHGKKMALERFREVIHFLRFLGNSVCGDHCGQSFGLRGEVEQGQVTELTFFGSHGSAIAMKNLSFPIEMAKIKPDYINLFNSILVKSPEKRTEMEHRLINAIVWMSKAIQKPSDSTKFLSCCIAIESLLCGDVKETISKTLSERLAFLLAKKKEDRVSLVKKMKKIYGIRSQIAHEGKPKKDGDIIIYLPYVMHYAKLSIFKVANLLSKEGWEKFEQLRDYLDDFKFS